ncbi:expressed unknown protein [Seminavis robusta]|uniref:Uncharacterized protein n=1 Tax=Seminavis robusta TaxID=568900 RepID=A0A9N8DTE6_9STRA|nr:expressed unknown protein [Seminavis robusta]|eukprot:Sro343_g122020.1 n/a (277) ;mRNA; f:45552-46382
MLLGACSETIDCYQLRHASTQLYLQATCDGRACSGHHEVTLVPSPQGAGALWYFVGNTATEVRLQNSRLGQTLGGEAAAVASFQPDNSQQPVSLDVDRLNVADYVQAAGIQFAMRNLHTSDFLWSDWEGYEYRLHPQRDLSLYDGRAHWQFQPINCDGDTSSTASKECSSITSVATEAILGGSGTHAYVTPGAEPFFEDVHAFHIQVVACDDMGSTSPATLGCIRIQSAIQSGRVIGIHYDEAKGQKELYLTDRSKDPSSNDLAWTWELLPASSGN